MAVDLLAQALRSVMAGARRHAAATADDESIRLVTVLVAQSRTRPGPLLPLALIAADQADFDSAETLLIHYLTAIPGDGMGWHQLGMARGRRGDDQGALECFRRATASLPDFAPSFNELGVILHKLGRPEEAFAAFDHAVTIDGGFTTAQLNRSSALVALGRKDDAAGAFQRVAAFEPVTAADWHTRALALFNLDDPDGAESACRRALAFDPPDLQAHLLLADILDCRFEGEEARHHRETWARLRGVITRPCLGGAVKARILLLCGIGPYNVPTDYLLDRQNFEIITAHILPDGNIAGAASSRIDALPAFDIIFNTIGDVDGGPSILAPAAALCREGAKPVLNPPELIPPTRRDLAPLLFAGIPHVTVPAIRRLTREEAMALSSTEASIGAAFSGAFLIRPVASHGGSHLQRVASGPELAAYLARIPAEAYYLCDYHDFRSPDGWYRKYRLVFVGGVVYPYHLAFATDWLVHYWRTEMNGWMKREEEDFLADHRAVFDGPRADALAEIARRLGLDYGGIDCTLTAAGDILLFEANATMLVHLNDPVEEFPYKHRAVPRIREAMSRMIEEHTRNSRE